MEFRKDMKVSDINKEGFKIRYKDLKKAIMECESKDNHHECKRILKELKIDIIDNE